MDILNTEDVLALSIFKCKVCCQRLQPPIFQIAHGNICGRCQIRSVYTNTKRNSEVEMFLSKLYITCNFKESGCTYKGPFGKTGNHEQNCRFRSRKCPFSHQQDCEFEYVNSVNIVEHIQNNHTDNVLKAKNDRIEFQTPTELHPNLLYLLQMRNTSILLRSMFKQAEERIYFTFYHFGQAEVLLALIFSEREAISKTRHESEILAEFDTLNAFKIASPKCEPLVKIRFPIERKKKYKVDGIVQGRDMPGAICSKCSCMVFDVIRYCSYCCKVGCHRCSICYCRKDVWKFNLNKVNMVTKFQCPNTGCQRIIGTNTYDLHRLYHCPFKRESCNKCKWSGCFLEFVKHNVEKHSLPINQQKCLLMDNEESYFINGDDIFIHKYVRKGPEELEVITVKLTQPYWSNSYTWIIKIKSVFESKNIALTGNYTINECRTTLNITGYTEENQLRLETYIKRN